MFHRNPWGSCSKNLIVSERNPWGWCSKILNMSNRNSWGSCSRILNMSDRNSWGSCSKILTASDHDPRGRCSENLTIFQNFYDGMPHKNRTTYVILMKHRIWKFSRTCSDFYDVISCENLQNSDRFHSCSPHKNLIRSDKIISIKLSPI